MAQAIIRSSLPNPLTASGGDAFTLAVYRDASVPWRLRVLARLQHGTRVVGEVVTQPYNLSGAQQARVIAAGSVPGALSWEVQGVCLATVGANRDLGLDLVAGVSGQNAAFVDFERRTIRNVSGIAAPLAPEASQRVRSLTVRSAAGGTVQFGAAAPITIPAGQAVSIQQVRPWGEPVTFAGTAYYLAEVEG